jgi:hypothetical protein
MNNVQAGRVVQLVTSAKITDGATASGYMDTIGFRYATVIVNLSAREGTDAAASTVSIQQGDTTSAYVTNGLQANQTDGNAAARNHVIHVDLKGKKRYIKVALTAGTSTGSDLTVGAVAILSKAEQMPVSTTAMVQSTNDLAYIV